jgi:hypothetical protein
MSLKARLRSLEAKVDWLERYGELRKVEQALEYRQSVKEVVDRLTANPTAAARFGITDLPRGRLALADAVAAGRAAVVDAAVPAAPRQRPPTPPERPPPDSPPEKPVAAPSPHTSSPKTEAWTHDPPEHMQIAKVTWRRRGPQDDLDNDEEEYDAFRRG